MQFSVFLVVDMDKLYPNPDKPEQIISIHLSKT